RHDRDAPARAKRVDGAMQRSVNVVNRPVAPYRDHRIHRLSHDVELDGVSAYELDVPPTVLPDAAPCLLQHADRAIEPDHATPFADRAREQREVAPGSATDVEHGAAFYVTD